MSSFRPLILLLILLSFTAVYAEWNGANINWAGYGAMSLFYLLIFYLGAVVAGKKRADQDVILAGRSLPLGIAVFTMSATWVGGGYINGTAEYTASSGLVWVQAPWGYALSLLIGGLFFAKKMRRYGFRTMLDPLEQRYGKRVTAMLFLPALSGELFWSAAILTALGTTFGTVLGLDTHTAIILSAAVAVAYTAIGGLLAVAYTDVAQMILLILGLLLVVPYAISYVGGWETMWTAYEAKHGAAASFLPTKAALGDHYWQWWDFALLLMFGGIPWQVYFQRVLAAKDENTAQGLSILAAGVCLLAAIPAVLIGMTGAVADWPSGPPPEAAATLPWVIQHLAEPWVATVGLGAVAAAVMSSVDSSMLSASSMAGWNIYRPLFRPKLNEAALQRVVKRCVIIVGLAATLLALRVKSVYALWFLCSDLVYCLLFPALVCALFDPKANWIGAASGFVVAAFLRIGGGEATLGIPAFIAYPMEIEGYSLFPFRTLAMVSGLLSILMISRMTQSWGKVKPLIIVNT